MTSTSTTRATVSPVRDAASGTWSTADLVAELRRALGEAPGSRAAARVDATTRRRAEYATDAGNYRVPPRVVVFPRSTEEVEAVLAVSRTTGVPLTSRGGGTSCAGNAIGPGIVVDFSRHLNRVLELDPEARTARVEPGCVQATLQAAARPHGLRFGPDPSSWTRATMGGLIGNNACGPHATAWGRTSDNVLAMDVVTGSGTRLDASRGAQALDVVPGLADLVTAHLSPIRTEFARFSRQVSGYAMEHLLPEHGTDLARFLVGSEGTLATTLGATVRLVPVASAPVLVALGYPSMAAAADAVPAILAHHPLAVEGMDARLVDVVRRHKGPGAVPPLPDGEGWLLVEMDATSGLGGARSLAPRAVPDAAVARAAEDAARAAEDAVAALDDTARTNLALAAAHAMARDAGTEAVAVYPPGSDAAALWRIRADGAGLGGRTPRGTQGWPGWEDAAVPPASLGRYLRDFEGLMAASDVDGLIYGHFGDGCVHVRLDLPLDSPETVPQAETFLRRAAELVASYGGSVSGEHGDGRSRSALLPAMYSPEVISLFGRVKALFDPAGLLNPGVLVDPDPLAAHLRRPQARPLPALTGPRGGFAFPEDRDDLTAAVHRCTGVGKCRAERETVGGFMCPSYRATHDEKDTTRARARVLQEVANGGLFHDFRSPEVRESLDLCLGCKACSTDCPAAVDVARLKSEALHRAFSGRPRPRTHYLLGWLPRWTRLVSAVPGAGLVANAVMGVAPLRRTVFRAAGIDPHRPMPLLASRSFQSWARSQGLTRRAAPTWSAPGADDVPPARGGLTRPVPPVDRAARAVAPAPPVPSAPRWVVLWADSFSQDLDDDGARAAARLLTDAGYRVIVPDRACCGLTWITTGQLSGARRRQRHLLAVLAPFAANGIPVVGVEPSCTAVLRDDLPALLPDDPRAAMLAAGTYTLAELLTAPAPLGPGELWTPPRLDGVEVVAQPHCHHYSVLGWETDRALLAALGATVTELQGCCGLAGSFGMETGHYEVSVAVAQGALLPALATHPEAVYLADGYSCRTQAAQLADRDGVHLARLLLTPPGP